MTISEFKIIKDIIDKFNKNHIEYLISGGYSLKIRKLINEYNNIDVFVKEEDIEKIIRLLMKYHTSVNKNKLDCTVHLEEINGQIHVRGVNEKTNPSYYQALINKKYDILTFNGLKLNNISLSKMLEAYQFYFKLTQEKKYQDRIDFLKKIL